MYRTILFCLWISSVSAKPKQTGQLMDEDGYHPYFLPNLDDPETWRDYINHPDDIIKEDWFALGQEELDTALLRTQNPIVKEAKNVIVFVGDGMGISTVTGARIFMAQQRNLTGGDTYLSFEKMPFTGMSRTYAVNQISPDSANTATAMFAGVKNREGVLLCNQNTIRYNCSSQKGNELESVLHKAINSGRVGGIVTTTRVTHATPGALYANSADRNWEADSDLPDDDRYVCEDIASQLVRRARNQQIKVVLGGGRANFFMQNETDPEYPEEMGKRLDANLIKEWEKMRLDDGLQEDQFSVVYNETDFDDVDVDKTEYLLGLFENYHMNYDLDREDPKHNKWAEPSLTKMAEKAIRILEKHDGGYFLMVEGGRIDSGHHENRAIKSMGDTLAFQDAIARAMEMVNMEETLVVVTADHSHVFTITGYPGNNADVRTFDEDVRPQVGTDGKPYTIYGYVNGPGYDEHRRNENGDEIPRINMTEISKEELTNKEWVYDAGVPLSSETHSGEDVGIWAEGPMAHLYHGTHEQSYIAHQLMYAMCVGPRVDLCKPPGPTPSGATSVTMSSTLALIITMIIHGVLKNY